MGALEDMLKQTVEALKPEGIVIMSYHSLEDRLIKNFLAKGFQGEVEGFLRKSDQTI